MPYRSTQDGLGPTAVIFDVGNVLYGWDPDIFLVRQIANDEARMRFVDEVGLWQWHETLDGGRPYDEAAAELSEKFPEYAHLIAAWGERFGETITDPIPGVHDLVETLDDLGVPLFAITNFSADFWPPPSSLSRLAKVTLSCAARKARTLPSFSGSSSETAMVASPWSA